MRKHKISKIDRKFLAYKFESFKVKRFSKNNQNKDKFFEYMFIDSGRILGLLGKEPPLIPTRKELKVDKAKDEWKKLIAQGWRRIKPFWEDS